MRERGRVMKKKVIFLLCICFVGLVGCGKVDDTSQKVIDDINSIGEVTEEDEVIIEKIEKIYITLTDKQKEQVDNYSTLLEARDEIDKLNEEKKNAENEEKEAILCIQREYYVAIDEAVSYLKSKCKNPASLEIKEIIVDAKPTDSFHPVTIYFDYSAQNGFGNDIKGTFMYWYGQGVGTEDEDGFFDNAKKATQGELKSCSHKIATDFYATADIDNLDIAESYFIVNFDDYQIK